MIAEQRWSPNMMICTLVYSQKADNDYDGRLCTRICAATTRFSSIIFEVVRSRNRTGEQTTERLIVDSSYRICNL
jgi:hypothetical protein